MANDPGSATATGRMDCNPDKQRRDLQTRRDGPPPFAAVDVRHCHFNSALTQIDMTRLLLSNRIFRNSASSP